MNKIKSFLYNLRYKIGRFVMPKDVACIPESALEYGTTQIGVDHHIEGFRIGSKMMLDMVKGYCDSIDGVSADDWCKKVYGYLNYQIENMVIESEKTETENSCDVKLSVPRNFNWDEPKTEE